MRSQRSSVLLRASAQLHRRHLRAIYRRKRGLIANHRTAIGPQRQQQLGLILRRRRVPHQLVEVLAVVCIVDDKQLCALAKFLQMLRLDILSGRHKADCEVRPFALDAADHFAQHASLAIARCPQQHRHQDAVIHKKRLQLVQFVLATNQFPAMGEVAVRLDETFEELLGGLERSCLRLPEQPLPLAAKVRVHQVAPVDHRQFAELR